VPLRAHYGLANVLRAINLNADRYVADRFPETDRSTPRLILDDLSRYLDDGFAERLEALVRAGACLVVSPATDELRKHRFLTRYGLTVAPLPPATRMVIGGQAVAMSGDKFSIGGEDLTVDARWDNGDAAIASRALGQGRVVVLGRSWDQWSHDLNTPAPYLDLCRDILCRYGEFTPNVRSSVVNVDVTPYRARDGALLLNVFNHRSTDQIVDLAVRQDLVAGPARFADLGQGVDLEPQQEGGYWRVRTGVPSLTSTVIRIESSRP
jgi:hypothetical protein